MAIEVQINNQILDLKAKAGIGLTLQVGSILNPSRRSGNLSNQFSVPKTKNNNTILGNLSNMNSSTTIPYQRNSAMIKQNGVEVFSDGFAVIGETSKEYKITVYSGNVSFFDLIKDKNVNELDFGSHQFIMAVITASFAGIYDFIYAIVDWGKGTDQLDNTDTQDANALFPLLYVKSIFEKIVESVGYSLKGSFVLSDSYNRLLLTLNQFGYAKEITDNASGIVFNPVSIDQDLVSYPVAAFHVFPIEFNSFEWDSYNQVGQEYEPDNTYIGRFSLHANGLLNKLVVPTANARIVIDILEDGVSILTATDLYNVNTGTVWDLDINTINVLVKKTSVYSAQVQVRIDSTIQDPTPAVNFTMFGGWFTFTALSDIRYTADVSPANFYNIGQDTVIKEVMNMYSLTVQANDLTKELHLNSLNDLRTNLPNAKDWSGKIDMRKTPSIKYSLSSYAQTNYFRYKKDDDVLGEFADSSFTVNDSTLQEVKDVITLKSVAVVNDLRVVNNQTPTIPLSEYKSQAFDKANSRFLLLDSKDQTVNFENSINSDTATVSVDIPFCYFNKAGESDSLDWTNLLNENYSVLLGMLDQSKIVNANFLLTETDIANIDFTIPIYLDVHSPDININGYFYLNKISNFQEGRATSVQLIRL
jgi:hypothetical protein